jgi:hypothetical protein
VTARLTPEQERLVEAVEKDHEVTHGAAASAETAVIANRSVGFTLIAALIGVAITRTSWPLMALAAVAAVFLYTIDGYYSWRAEERRRYLRLLERILAAHFTAVARAPENASDLKRLDSRLQALRVGVISQSPKFKWRDPFFSNPKQLFWGLYPLLLAFAVAASIYLGAFHEEPAPAPSPKGGLNLCIGCMKQESRPPQP